MIGHEIITASAGAGKTWSLTLRYIRLLTLGAPPASIIALTFSRKAAGEFFTAILHRLAAAASGDRAAAQLAHDAAMPHLTRKDFTGHLAALVREMPRLTLGTMDAFFVRIAKSFPLELGLAGDFSILDDHQRGLEQQRVLRRVFAPGALPGEARREFMNAFQQATWGKDEVRLRSLLDDFLKDWQNLYLAAPGAGSWGNPAAIWPDGSPFLRDEPSPGDLAAAARAAMERSDDLKESQKVTLGSLLTALAENTPGTPLPPAEKRTLAKLLEQLPALARGSADITLRTKTTLHAPLTGHLHAVVTRFVRDTIAICLHQTKGIHGILSLYDRHYHGMVRRQGKLTFQDVQLILSGDLAPEAREDGTPPGPGGLAGTARESIDYRLDARYRHWLLDEFQDTSRVQWKVLRNLCDEVIQDRGGSRTFFAVGDEKQSIFTWRGAEPGLFGEILGFYNQGEPLISVRPLALSQRSGPPVIRMVNRLCGDPARLAELERISGGAARWPWQPHTSAHPERTGCGVVIEVPDRGEPGGVPPAWEACGEWLRQLKPLQRGLSCAVILHRNAQATKCADVLRRITGMEVVCESDVSIATDNPASTALLALLKAAAHPADQYSWQHVLMSPFAAVLHRKWPQAEGRTAHHRNASLRFPFTTAVLRRIASVGFAPTLREWREELETALPGLDSFSRGRMEDLCRAAQEFDESGNRDIDEFLTFAAHWTVRESAHRNAIQVLTLHKSKGLTFDIVMLPDLGDNFMFNRRTPIGIGRDAEGGISWLTMLPARDIAAAEPVIGRALAEMEAAQWRERIAQLYVAVTRAKRAKYILLPPAPEKPAESVNLPRLIRHMLGDIPSGKISIGARECDILSLEGDLAWIDTVPVIPPPQRPGGDDLFSLFENTAPPAPGGKPARRAVRRASTPARAMEGRHGRRYGTFVHQWLSRIEWLKDTTPGDLRQAFARLFPRSESWQQSAFDLVLRCLDDPATARAFTRPSAQAVVWRERPFEMILDNTHVSGVFDRVILEQDRAGRPVSARLIEFKTDAVHDAAGLRAAVTKHQPQTAAYRAALRQLTGLPPEQIRAEILFTTLPAMAVCPGD